MEAAKTAKANLIKKIQKIFDTHEKILIDFDTALSYEKLQELITSKYVGDALEEMMTALMDDFNTPQLIAILNQSLSSIDKMEEVDTKDFFVALHWLEKNLLKVGLFDRIDQEKETIEIPSEITSLADQRLQAKQEKNYALADELRNKITAAGREVKDTKDGYELNKL
jgi:cysteinyl-tRNA synthetase